MEPHRQAIARMVLSVDALALRAKSAQMWTDDIRNGCDMSPIHSKTFYRDTTWAAYLMPRPRAEALHRATGMTGPRQIDLF